MGVGCRLRPCISNKRLPLLHQEPPRAGPGQAARPGSAPSHRLGYRLVLGTAGGPRTNARFSETVNGAEATAEGAREGNKVADSSHRLEGPVHRTLVIVRPLHHRRMPRTDTVGGCCSHPPVLLSTLESNPPGHAATGTQSPGSLKVPFSCHPRSWTSGSLCQVPREHGGLHLEEPGSLCPPNVGSCCLWSGVWAQGSSAGSGEGLLASFPLGNCLPPEGAWGLVGVSVSTATKFVV